MEEEKLAKKGITYPATVKGMDYVEYQGRWVMKKKLKKMDSVIIEKNRSKYLKYIELFDAELQSRISNEMKKKQEEEEKEKALMEELMKKYNKK